MSQACQFCSASFSTAEDFEAHMELMHRCQECGMRLSSEQDRDRHLLQAHGKQWVLEEPLEPVVAQLEKAGSPEEIPTRQDAEERYRWLHPFCLRIAEAKYPEAAWRDVPEELQDQARYAEHHFASITRAMQNVRYTRLKSAEPKARYLAMALTLPEHGPAYAEQKL